MSLMSLLLFTLATVASSGVEPEAAPTLEPPAIEAPAPEPVRALQPTYIEEGDDAFLKLWPHRWDYIQAEHPQPGERPEWSTNSKHPLSDRLIDQGSYLYGVRIGPQTNYCLIDIDITSAYHPRQDPFALQRLQEALEPLGLVRAITCTSSDSKGIHLYFPFSEAQPSWKIAAAVTTLLENQGYKPAPGQLEIFPQLKPYLPGGSPTLYNGHRLPMQAGSYLLNEVLEPIRSSRERFTSQWQLAQAQNDLSAATLEQLLKQCRRVRHRLTASADKFLNDLNAEIEVGWSGAGQTNQLLGRIAMRSYVFGHILYAEAPLKGQALVDDIVTIARALPGYADYCDHQDKIEERAAEWARCVQRSPKYYPYSQSNSINEPASESSGESENERRAREARARLCAALAELEERSELPAGATARARALSSYGISLGTLYKHKELWHPNRLQAEGTRELQAILGADGQRLRLSVVGIELRADGGKKLVQIAVPDAPRSQSGTAAALEEGGFGGETPSETSEVEGNGTRAGSSGSDERNARGSTINGSPHVQRNDSTPLLGVSCAQEEERWEQLSVAFEGESQEELNGGAISVSEHEREGVPELSDEPLDLSEVLVQIQLQQRRLGWSAAEIARQLQAKFGKSSPRRLDDLELVEWLQYLQGEVVCEVPDG